MKSLFILFAIIYPLSILGQNIDRVSNFIDKFDERYVIRYKEPNYMTIDETKTLLSKLGNEFDLSNEHLWVYFTAELVQFNYRNNQIQVNANTCIQLNFNEKEFDTYFSKFRDRIGEKVKISGMILFKIPFNCTEFKNVVISDF